MELDANEREKSGGKQLDGLAPPNPEIQRLLLEESRARLKAFREGKMDSVAAELLFAELRIRR